MCFLADAGLCKGIPYEDLWLTQLQYAPRTVLAKNAVERQQWCCELNNELADKLGNRDAEGYASEQTGYTPALCQLLWNFNLLALQISSRAAKLNFNPVFALPVKYCDVPLYDDRIFQGLS